MPRSTGTIGEYIVTAKIGSGSFAIVYKGHHRHTHLPVAIKAIHREKLNQKLQENLESEIAIMQTIHHPNIVELYEIKKTEKHIYLILEYCAGGDLQKFIKRQKVLQESTARHFIHELGKGLAVLWKNNLIHRDLKPQNLLLDADSTTACLKIADFGFARHLAAAAMAETLCGSPLYMAPEILKFQKYDAKADLWSVGTILFEMITGKPPFGGANHIQLLANIERNELRFPENISVSQDCIGLLQGLLRRKPMTRMPYDDFFKHAFVQIDPSEAANLKANTLRTDATTDTKSPSTASPALSPTISPDSPPLQVLQDGSLPKDYSLLQKQAKPLAKRRSSNRAIPGKNDAEASSGTTTGIPNSAPSSLNALTSVFGSSSTKATTSASSPVDVAPPPLSAPIPRTNPFKVISESPPGSTSMKPPLSRGTPPSGKMDESNRIFNRRMPKTKPSTGNIHPSNGSIDSNDDYVLVDRTTSPPNQPSQRVYEGAPKGIKPSTMKSLAPVQFESTTDAIRSIEQLGQRAQAVAQLGDRLALAAVASPSLDAVNEVLSDEVAPTEETQFDAAIKMDGSSNMGSEVQLLFGQAFTLYMKALCMFEHAISIAKQTFSTIPTKDQPLSQGNVKVKGHPTSMDHQHLRTIFSLVTDQFGKCLERAEQCRQRLPKETTLVDDVDDLLYSQAIILGREAAVKEVLGQHTAAQLLYTQAKLLLETLTLSKKLDMEDEQLVQHFMKALKDRIRVT